MAPQRLDAAKRKAASHVMFMLFHLLASCVVHPLRMLTGTPRPTAQSLHDGLSEKELELLEQKMGELDEIAEVFRKMGWRLKRSS